MSWLAFALLIFSWNGRAWAKSDLLALTHVTVIDGSGTEALPDRTVLITGDRITSITSITSITAGYPAGRGPGDRRAG
ncbi:hypothetical protein BH18VER2_BH18VER2_14720 [soil metagenome]